jgi:hypothetical protein
LVLARAIHQKNTHFIVNPFSAPIFLSFYVQLRIEMENYSPYTDHGLSIDRTSIVTGLFNTRVDSIESSLYCQ